MPHRTWEFRIADIVEAINNVLNYTDGMRYDNFVKDRKTSGSEIFIRNKRSEFHRPPSASPRPRTKWAR